MANTIGFGQAAVNNTIDYGQGAIDNTINWGKSQTLSPSGETNITGTGGTPPFSNVNSFSFDGVDDYFLVPDTSGLSFGNGTTDSPFSISAWIKIGQTTAQGIVTKYGSSSSTREYLFYTTGGKLRLLFIDANNGANNFATGTTSLSTNTWYHVACTYDGRGGSTAYNGITLYINGVAESVTTSGGSYTAMSNTSQNVEIGKYSTNELLGNIDETAIFTTELSQSDITAIYNNGEPQSLNTYSPFVWFRMGDNATWNGATWTMTSVGTDTRIARSINMVEANRTTDVPTASSFSNTKSILLDGVDDYVDCGDNDNLSFGNGATDSPFSISAWVNMTDATRFRIVFKADNTTGNNEYGFFCDASDRINFVLYDSKSNVSRGRYYNVGLSSYQGQWINLVATYDGQGGTSAQNGIKIYLNGTQVDNVDVSTGTYTAMHNGNAPLEIGKFLTNRSNGLMDEIAIFNVELSASDVTSIYGGGVPSSLSSYSSLVSWWRCGDGDTAPILTDNGSGGNDGTMTNFTTFSTDVPT